MTQWYYAHAGERAGPIDTDALRSRLESGELNGDTLIWREGMSQWQAARELAGELAWNGAETMPEAGGFAGGADAPDAGATAYAAASPYAAPTAATALHVAPVVGHDIVLAGFWKRFAASCIDGLVMGVVMFAIIMIGMLLAGGAGVMNPNAFTSELAQGTLGVGFILMFYIVPIACQAAYFTWMHASASQATLGKMAVGIKVTRGDGGALTLARSLGRWASYFFLSLVTCNLALLVSAIMSGVTERKQGLHDLMVDSLVVDKWAFTGHPERQQRGLGTVTWVVIVLFALAFVAYFGLLIFGFTMGMASAARS